MRGAYESSTLPSCLMLIVACQDQGTSFDGKMLGKFAYTAYDTLGTELSHGTLTLFQNDSKITGAWQFEGGRSGKLEGTVRSTELNLNLNLGFIDNNLLLQGTISDGTFSGLWQQIGLPGIMDRGLFTAIRQ